MTRLRSSMVYRSSRLVFRAAPGLATLLFLASVGLATLNPAIAYTAMRLCEAILAGSTSGAVHWVVSELVLVASITIVGRLRMDARTLLRGRVELETRLQIASRAGELELAQLEEASMRDAIDAARVAAERRPLELVNELLTIFQSSLSLLIFAFMLASFNAWALLLLVAAIPGAAAELWSSRVGASGQAGRVRDGRRLKYFQDLLFSETHGAENNFLEIGPDLLGRSRELGGRLFAQERVEWRRSVVVVLACQLLPPVILNGCYLFMALETVRGTMTLGVLMLYGLSLNGAQRLNQALLMSGRGAMACWQHVRALFGFLDATAARRTLVAARPDGKPASPAAAGLRLENVSFRYPGADAWAIRHLDITIRPGELVAIIGGNGCGKTTLLKLITGLHSPSEGRITLDGVDLAALDPVELRQRYAVVFQEFARYGLTVRENVAVGLAAPDEDAAAVRAALHTSGAEDLVAQLPAGVETELIPALENGVGLSGGQWQKIALARGLVRTNAEFLVLDEPTAALDSESERRLFAQLRQMQPRRTVVLITHRLSSLHATDKVVLLERGRQVSFDQQPSKAHPELHRLARVFADT